MKKLSYLLTALILLGSGVFSSCDKVKDLLEITLTDVEFTVDFNASDLNLKIDPIPFSVPPVTFDPKDNAELAPYLETVRRVEVTEVKITVNSATSIGEFILNDAIFTLTDTVNSDVYSYTTTAPITLEAGTIIMIGGETPDYSKISDIISALHVASLGMEGHINQPGLLDLTFTIKADITVGVPRD